jgi:translation initiation factor IF-3
LSKDEAIQKAKELGLDLVEVAANAQPPVARIVDFQKFRYQENKKEQQARKNRSQIEVKEIWLSPRIAEHDLLVRLKRADEFLDKGNKVKLTVKFRGREMAHPEVGHVVVKSALSYFGDKIAIERETKFEGRNLTTIIGLNKQRSDDLKKSQAEDLAEKTRLENAENETDIKEESVSVPATGV